jgi:hypothetical protein
VNILAIRAVFHSVRKKADQGPNTVSARREQLPPLPTAWAGDKMAASIIASGNSTLRATACCVFDFEGMHLSSAVSQCMGCAAFSSVMKKTYKRDEEQVAMTDTKGALFQLPRR